MAAAIVLASASPSRGDEECSVPGRVQQEARSVEGSASVDGLESGPVSASDVRSLFHFSSAEHDYFSPVGRGDGARLFFHLIDAGGATIAVLSCENASYTSLRVGDATTLGELCGKSDAGDDSGPSLRLRTTMNGGAWVDAYFDLADVPGSFQFASTLDPVGNGEATLAIEIPRISLTSVRLIDADMLREVPDVDPISVTFAASLRGRALFADQSVDCPSDSIGCTACERKGRKARRGWRPGGG